MVKKLVKTLEDYPEFGLVSVPSYSDPNLNLHRPGSYHLKYWMGNNTVITNRVSGMIMATMKDIIKAAPFVKFWPNFCEDVQFSKQVHQLGFFNAYIYPADAYVIHEDMKDRATSINPNTLRNVLLHEGLTAYLESEDADEISETMAVKRLLVYSRDNRLTSAREFFRDFKTRVCCFLNGNEAPLRELLTDYHENEWLKDCQKIIQDVIAYLEEHREQIVDYKTQDQINLSGVNPNLGVLQFRQQKP